MLDFFYQHFFVFCHAKEVWCLRSIIAEEDELIDGIKSRVWWVHVVWIALKSNQFNKRNQQMLCMYFCSYFCWRRLPGHYQPLHSLEFVYTVFWGTGWPHLRIIFLGITHLQGGGFKYFLLNFHPENWGRFPIWRAYFSDGLKPPTWNHQLISTLLTIGFP